MINYTVKTVSKVNYGDLETLIETTYGIKEFSVPASEECGNDTSLEGTANPSDLDKYDLEDIAAKKTEYMMHNYINDLAAKGLFPLGDYVVRVSW